MLEQTSHSFDKLTTFPPLSSYIHVYNQFTNGDQNTATRRRITICISLFSILYIDVLGFHVDSVMHPYNICTITIVTMQHYITPEL